MVILVLLYSPFLDFFHSFAEVVELEVSSSFWASVLYIVSVFSISIICINSLVIGQVLACIQVVVVIIIVSSSVVISRSFSCVVCIIVGLGDFSLSPPFVTVVLDHTLKEFKFSEWTQRKCVRIS